MRPTPRIALVSLLVALPLAACGSGAPTGTPAASSASASAASVPSASAPADQAALDDQLLAAAWANDVAEARRLIERGADVNVKDATQQSAYLVTTSEGYLELLKLTLANGAQVDDKDSWNGTGLIRAAERGHFLVVGELLRAGTDRDHINRIGYQAIHEAILFGAETPQYAATVRVLAAGGVELDHRSPSAGLTPLEMARERRFPGLEGILQSVIGTAQPADPDAALLRAAQAGDADAVAVALRAGANIEARDPDGRTALLLATARGHSPVQDVLVAMGANPAASVDD